MVARDTSPMSERSSTAGEVRLGFALVGAHLRGRRGRGSRRASLALAVVGMGAGVMMLTSVLGIMNGLQLGYIEDLVEIGSFHLRVSRADYKPVSPDVVADIRQHLSVRTVMPIADIATMVGRSGSNFRHAITLRFVPPDAATRDPSLARELNLSEAPLLAGTVMLGTTAANRLGVRIGDTVTMNRIDRTTGDQPVVRASSLVIADIFESSFTEFDLRWALTSFLTSDLASESGLPLEYGIKLTDRFREGPARKAIESILAKEYPDRDYRVQTWRDFNQAFYGALRTEKLLMSTLIGMVFVVVGFNIFQGMRRRIQERRQEIGVLRALGATPNMLRLAYSVESAVGGVVGVTCGLAAGLAIANNLTFLLRVTSSIVNTLVKASGKLMVRPKTGLLVQFGAWFQLEEIPNRVLLHEAVLTCAVAISVGLIAAVAGGRWLSVLTPDRVMREGRE